MWKVNMEGRETYHVSSQVHLHSDSGTSVAMGLSLREDKQQQHYHFCESVTHFDTSS